MRFTRVIPVLLLVVIIGSFVSCQKEIDPRLLGTTSGDTTAQVTPMFRVVDIDMTSPAQDSIIWIFKKVTNGTAKNVIQSRIDPLVPGDTVNYVYSYDAAGKLVNVKGSHSVLPSLIVSESKFTWSSGRLTRAQFDTMGAMESSIDFVYTPAGTNTLVTPTFTPSPDIIQLPTYSNKFREQFTVNAAFQVISQKFISHTYAFQSGEPENTHDTVDVVLNYVSGDLGSNVFYHMIRDTSGPGGSIINTQKDTITNAYTRAAGGGNFADSLISIYGNEIYNLMSIGILYDPNRITDFGFEDFKGFFFKKPTNTSTATQRIWINGVFDAVSSYSNLSVTNRVNTIDSQQRLARCEIYADFNNSLLEYVLKFTY